MDLQEHIHRSGPSNFDDSSGKACENPNTVNGGMFGSLGVANVGANPAFRQKSSYMIDEYYRNPRRMAPTTLSRKVLLLHLTPQRQLQIRWRTVATSKHGKVCSKTGEVGLSNLQILLCKWWRKSRE